MNKKLLLLIGLSLVLYGANLWGTSIYILDEAKNAGCSMEMASRGDWVVPTFNDELRTDKPPLHYYFMRVAYSALGVSAFSARLFSVIMGIGMVVAVYLLSRSVIGEKAAFISAIILVVSIQLTVQFHLAVPDPYLIFFLTLGWLSFYRGYSDDAVKYKYLFYVSIAIATLAKGPIAIVLTGLIVLVFLGLSKRLTIKELQRLKLLQGALLFLCIVLPWYIVVGIKTEGVWLQQFFFEHNVGRFTSTMEGHGGFPLASVVIVLVALMPFSFFAPQAVTRAWKKRRDESFALYCLVVVVVIVVFFAFSRTILPSYVEPALPFMALLLGHYFNRRKKAIFKTAIWSGMVYLIISLLIPMIALIALQHEEGLSDLSYVAGFCIILTLGGIVGLVFILEKKLMQALYTYATSSVLFLLVFFYWIYPQIDFRNPVSNSLAKMNTERGIVAYKQFNPAFVFSLKKPVPVLGMPEELESLSVGNYVLTQKRYLEELNTQPYKIVYQGRDLFEGRTTVVLEIQ